MKNNKDTRQKLADLRGSIDTIDASILELLAERMAVVRKIRSTKQTLSAPPRDMKRWRSVLTSRRKMARMLNLQVPMVEALFKVIHAYSIKLQKQL